MILIPVGLHVTWEKGFLVPSVIEIFLVELTHKMHSNLFFLQFLIVHALSKLFPGILAEVWDQGPSIVKCLISYRRYIM